ncbi:hypothetical protein B0H15DRAFT_655517 [Mycena belliarum]|uniref:Uncharacterized protein n=1 Tax=Mycena belliarum TaxID=1033014 RepID=A0AAD6TP95_9AGAR|nr:hypothetical protein B0H15DRAFT_655517 [Mycena belliae]
MPSPPCLYTTSFLVFQAPTVVALEYHSRFLTLVLFSFISVYSVWKTQLSARALDRALGRTFAQGPYRPPTRTTVVVHPAIRDLAKSSGRIWLATMPPMKAIECITSVQHTIMEWLD